MAHANRILIIDDCETTDGKLERWLESVGWEAVFTEAAVSVVEVARREEPTAIVLDLAAAAGEGFALIERLRQVPELYLTPIVVVSDRDGPDRERALATGADTLVSRPVEWEQLAYELRRLRQLCVPVEG